MSFDWRLVDWHSWITEHVGIQWFRAHVQIIGRQTQYDVLAISMNRTVSACDVYWDGRFVDENGVVASSRENEVPGKLEKIIKLKREVTTPGVHLWPNLAGRAHLSKIASQTMGVAKLDLHWIVMEAHGNGSDVAYLLEDFYFFDPLHNGLSTRPIIHEDGG